MELDRQVIFYPLTHIWNETEVVSRTKLRDLDYPSLANLLRSSKVRFVVADVGHRPEWIPVSGCYKFWKNEVKERLAVPGDGIYLEDFPGDYCYLASEWKSDNKYSVIVLVKFH